jgi:hypothetical protein
MNGAYLVLNGLRLVIIEALRIVADFRPWNLRIFGMLGTHHL